MNVSIFLAQFFGLYLLLIAIPLIGNPAHFFERYQASFEHEAIQLFSGFFHLMLGLVYILLHNLWVNDWRIVITLIGWLVLLEGISIVYFPTQTKNIFRKYVREIPPYLWGTVCLCLSVFLIYKGFF